jgi:FeS assembly protein IscX
MVAAQLSQDPLYWDDAYGIALLLKKAHPQVEPTELDLGTLANWAVALDGFCDAPDGGYAEILEAIQAEWIDLNF